MLIGEREQIYEKAKWVNRISDEYQLIHATFALEKILNDEIKAAYEKEITKLREEIANETEPEKLALIFQRAKELKEVQRQKKIKICLIYLKEIEEDSARTTKTKNTYMILLPEKLKEIRNADGSMNFEKLRRLRHLIAHELGHIFLHSDSILCEDSAGTGRLEGKAEEEADCFAAQLIELQRRRNQELFTDGSSEV